MLKLFPCSATLLAVALRSVHTLFSASTKPLIKEVATCTLRVEDWVSAEHIMKVCVVTRT